MSTDSIDPDTEIYELQLKLVHGFAEMDREIEAKNREEQSMTHANGIRGDALRLSRAEAINERADQFMGPTGRTTPRRSARSCASPRAGSPSPPSRRSRST